MSLRFPWHVTAYPVSTPCLCFIKHDSLQSATIFFTEKSILIERNVPFPGENLMKGRVLYKSPDAAFKFQHGSYCQHQWHRHSQSYISAIDLSARKCLAFSSCQSAALYPLTTANVVQIYSCTAYFPNIQLLS